MITPSELRTGNLIIFKSTDTIEAVLDIETANRKTPIINNVHISDVEPIPITEEWLFKFGYEGRESISGKNEYFFFENQPHQIWKPFNKFLDEQYRFEIKYVHQLQNLYFALTGKELNNQTPNK